MAGNHLPRQARCLQKNRFSNHSRIAKPGMIVLDASVVVELLINGPPDDSIRDELASSTESFPVPHLINVEALSAFHRLTSGRPILIALPNSYPPLQPCPPSVTPTCPCSIASGNCATTSPPTTPSISGSPKQLVRSSIPATKNYAAVTAPRSCSSPPEAPE